MTDLSDLKNIWKGLSEDLDHNLKSEEELSRLVMDKSTNQIDRVTKAFYWEFFAAALATIVLLVGVFSPAFPVAMKMIFAVSLGLILITGVRFYLTFTKVKIVGPVLDIRRSLAAKILELKKFITFYYLVNIILLPIAIVVGFSFRNPKILQKLATVFFETDAMKLGITLGFCLVFIVIYILILKWYVNKNYSKPLKNLEDCYSELIE